MTTLTDRFSGCFLGLALGDARGAPREGGPLERFAWRVLGRTRGGEMRWTDDTQMSLDLAESLIANGRLDRDDLALRFARSYRWSRGYGAGTAKLLKRIARGAPWQEARDAVRPGGSFGNGGAMRSPIVGLFHGSRSGELVSCARDAARVTHAHPLGVEGAVLIAAATAKALDAVDWREMFAFAARTCEQAPFRARLRIAEGWLGGDQEPSPGEVVRELGSGVAAVDSCVTALYLALRFLPAAFTEMIHFVARCGGDVDTIGAMAGAIWGAAQGLSALPDEWLCTLEERARIERVAEDLYRARPTPEEGA